MLFILILLILYLYIRKFQLFLGVFIFMQWKIFFIRRNFFPAVFIFPGEEFFALRAFSSFFSSPSATSIGIGDDKHGHRLDQHAAESQDCHRNHNIGSLSGRSEDGEQGDQGGRGCHGWGRTRLSPAVDGFAYGVPGLRVLSGRRDGCKFPSVRRRLSPLRRGR